jgi:hypothetical protein
MRNFPMNVKDYAEYKMKKEIEERKTALQTQHDDVNQKITQGRNALGNLEATLMGLKGAISQIDWVLGLFVDEKKDK